MSVPLPAWLMRAADGIRDLADRPATLFCLLLAINALARPCYATTHDAHLYSLQALNQAEAGAYADDIFLRFGSQDQFSLFSRALGPLVALIGVRTAFFLGYLVGNTLFLFALFRLVRTLVADPVIATLALIYLVAAPLSYGGFDIFTVHEQFFTPRLIGSVFMLFALERTLTRHFVQALLLLIAGSLMHPLMAFGGIMIWAGYLAITHLPMRAFLAGIIFALLAGVALLAVPSAGIALFGYMDADWHELIRLAVGYNYPDTWTFKDWLNVAASLLLPVAACYSLYRDDPERRRFFAVVALAGFIGLAVTIAASLLPYALLFQGQPYRVLWILRVFQVPLGFLLIAKWSGEPRLRFAALGLIGFFCITHFLPHELALIAIAVALSIGISRLREESEPHASWYAAARGLVLGNLLWMAYRWWFLIAQRDAITSQFDFNECLLFDMISPLFWMVGLCMVICRSRLGRSNEPGFATPRAAVVAAAIALVTPTALFALDASPQFRRDHTRHGADVELVRDFLAERNHGTHRPTVYWCLDRTDLIWTDVHANSYFGILQTAGVMFNRQTATEIDRRIQLVAKFEMAQQRGVGVFLDDAKKVGMENLLKVPFDCPEPTRDDLIRLCQEPGLDYVVIKQEFPGLYSASNGRIFVYECYKVKTSPTTRKSP